MRSKNISFAEVLRSKPHRSPQLQSKNSINKLSDLMQQWEKYPLNDYTLYLGPTQYSRKSQYSTSRMINSKNQRQEQMFDSWIEKQSMVTQKTIKDNSQGFRLKNYDSNKVSQGSTRVNFNSRAHENSKSPKSIAQLVRKNKDTLHVENLSQFANLGGNIQMIKSKTCQNQKKSMPTKQPHYRFEIQTNQDDIQSIPTTKEVRYQENNNTFLTNKNKQINQMPKRTAHFKNVLENRKKQQSIEDLVGSTTNITNEIAELAKKYLDQEQQSQLQCRQNNSQLQSSQNQELLIEDSGKKPIPNDDPMFSQEYLQRARKTEELDRLRKEQAKNKINDLMKHYKFGKKNEQIFYKPQVRFEEPSQNQVKFDDNYQVGYSFASNQPQQFRTQTQTNQIVNENDIKNIYSQLYGEKPLKLQSSQELQFKQKYVNYESNQSPIQENICNFNSIKYNIKESFRQQQGVVNQNKPNNSFEKRLITSQKDNQVLNPPTNQQNVNFYKQLPRKNSIQQFSKIEVVSKQIKNNSLSNASQLKAETQTNQNKSFNQQFGRFPHQKIKIVSSGKNHNNSNKSHKSGSAKSTEEKIALLQAPKQIKIQPFVPIVQTNIQSQKSNVLAEIKQIKGRQGCSPFKTIKQVKNSIINPIKSPETLETNNVSTFEANPMKFQPSKQQKLQPLYKQKTYQFGLKKDEIKLTNTSNYIQPTYGSKNSNTYQSNFSYYTRQYTKQINLGNNPTTFALPTSNQDNIHSAYSIKTLKSSKEIVNEQYHNATYAQTPFLNSKTHDYHEKYEPKYATINSSYQVCQKFNSILNLTKKQFPDVQKQNNAKPKQIVFQTNNQAPGKKSILTELDIKQSINFQEADNKKVESFNTFKFMQQKRKQATHGSSGLDNVIKKSLKQSISIEGSGQFKFDF